MPHKPRWTDEQLRIAVAQATSVMGVQRLLGLRRGGGGHTWIQRRIAALGLDTSHFTSSSGTRAYPWTLDELRAAVAASSRIAEVLDRLSVTTLPGAERKIRRQIRSLAISTQHFVSGRNGRGKRRSWTDPQLIDAVARSLSIAGTLRALGLVPAGGNYDHVQRRMAELELDTGHFTGSGWNVGLKYQPRPAIPLEEVLVANRWVTTHNLKLRLFREGLKRPACELCGWAIARPCDGVVPVELDHVNGDRTDNRLENLRVLCPNCHSLQPTHRGLNRRSRAREWNLRWLPSESNRH